MGNYRLYSINSSKYKRNVESKTLDSTTHYYTDATKLTEGIETESSRRISSERPTLNLDSTRLFIGLLEFFGSPGFFGSV